MNNPSNNYKWGREPVEAGYYMALLKGMGGLDKDAMTPALVYVEYRDWETPTVGAHTYTGKDHVAYGSPALRDMSEDFLMWARLPDPLD